MTCGLAAGLSVAIISYMFSIPQLITASAGGIIAAMILPSLKKAIRVT